MITNNLKVIESYSLKRLEGQNPSKTEPCVIHGAPKRALCHPKGSQKCALVTQGGPKIDKNSSRDPFGKQGASRTQTGPPPQNFLLACFGFSCRPWSLQGSILDPGGVPKMVQNRHGEARSAPWGANKCQKALPKGVPKWGRKSDRKGVPK